MTSDAELIEKIHRALDCAGNQGTMARFEVEVVRNRLAELRGIARDLAKCEVSEEVYTHPINVPDDVDQWGLIERARKAGE